MDSGCCQSILADDSVCFKNLLSSGNKNCETCKVESDTVESYLPLT